MAVPWPVSLQEFLSEDNWEYVIQDTALRSDMDIGPKKTRRRYTRGVNQMRASIMLTSAQFTIFYNFFNTTTSSGTIAFEFDHPITGTLTEWKFTGSPNVRSIGGGNFMVSYELEEQP